MALGFTSKAQLQAEWASAKGFLVKQLDELYAALAALSPLTDNLKLPYEKSAALLTNSVGMPALHQQVGCVAQCLQQTIPTATLTQLNFTSVTDDIGPMFTGALPQRLTVPTGGDGYYMVVAIVPFANGAGVLRQIRITKNDAVNLPLLSFPAVAGTTQALTLTQRVKLVTGDFLGLQAYQDSGGNLSVDAVGLTAWKLGAA